MKMNALETKEKLKNILPNCLLGDEAFMEMMPMQEGRPMRSIVPDKNSQPNPSAVLILFDREFNMPLTLRNRDLKHHPGEISFPGGRKEGDESPIQTALREAEEEIGLNGESVEIVGKLSQLYLPHSSSMITPVIAYVNDMPEFITNPDEVEDVIITDLYHLAFEAEVKFKTKSFANVGTFEVPYWDLGIPEHLWGASAMMLNELIRIMKKFF
jgi:8-oxo-dGTP pyrophosphatase MutT (NUDIX family)